MTVICKDYGVWQQAYRGRCCPRCGEMTLESFRRPVYITDVKYSRVAYDYVHECRVCGFFDLDPEVVLV